VALAAAAAEARLVHVSSDAVFSGSAASCDDRVPRPHDCVRGCQSRGRNGGQGCCSGCRHRPYLADIGDGDWAREKHVHDLAAGT
jgi:dTDP-4-dehydrorhamnose reductase